MSIFGFNTLGSILSILWLVVCFFLGYLFGSMGLLAIIIGVPAVALFGGLVIFPLLSEYFPANNGTS